MLLVALHAALAAPAAPAPGAKTTLPTVESQAMPGMPLDGPISWGITLDEKNPDRYIVGVSQSGLSPSTTYAGRYGRSAASQSRLRRMPCATRSPFICWRPAPTYVRSSYYSAIAISAPRHATC